MVNIYPSKAQTTIQPTFFTVNFAEVAVFYDLAVYKDSFNRLVTAKETWNLLDYDHTTEFFFTTLAVSPSFTGQDGTGNSRLIIFRVKQKAGSNFYDL